MGTVSKRTTVRIIKIAMIAVLAVLLMIGLSAYLIIHSYINKINLVITKMDDAQVEYSDDTLEDESDDFSVDNPFVVESEEGFDIQALSLPEEEIISLETQIRENMEDRSTPLMEDKEVFNILLIGSDSRTTKETGRSDAMILLSVNKNTKTITATSLLRDIYVQIPGKSNNRLNAAYTKGGADLLMDTIEQNFKIKIDRYASVNFYAFINIVDAIGGISMEVTEEEIPVINNYIKEINNLTEQEENKDLLTEAGTLIMNGKQTLGFSRNRYVGNIDFDRTARQRRVLEQVFAKVKDIKLTKLDDLLNKILPEVTTNLTEGELFSLILSLPTYMDYPIEQWSIPVKGSYSFLTIRGMSVLGIDFKENIDEINSRIYN